MSYLAKISLNPLYYGMLAQLIINFAYRQILLGIGFLRERMYMYD